jgi:hypothetical protein
MLSYVSVVAITRERLRQSGRAIKVNEILVNNFACRYFSDSPSVNAT